MRSSAKPAGCSCDAGGAPRSSSRFFSWSQWRSPRSMEDAGRPLIVSPPREARRRYEQQIGRRLAARRRIS